MRISHTDNTRSPIYLIAGTLIIVSLIYFFFADSLRPFFANTYTHMYNRVFNKSSTVSTLESRIGELENQNADLKNMLKSASLTEDFINQGQIGLLQTSIVFNVPPMIYNEVLLNKGSDDGIALNALVFVRGLHPVGFISDIYTGSAKVSLFSEEKRETEGVLFLKKDHPTITPRQNTQQATQQETIVEPEVSATTGEGALATTSSTTSLPVVTTSGSGERTVSIIVRGDGAYGLIGSLSDIFEVSVGDLVYLKSNPDYAFGTIAEIISNQNEKMNNIYIRSFYEPNAGHFLYVER